MPVPKPSTDADPAMSAIDAVFEKLLAEIVRGVHSAGSRLPAERELSRQLGASRPTLREALRRLGEWNLIEPRRGSGIVVRPYRDWSIEVLGAYLRYGQPGADQPPIARLLLDMLELRRALVLEVLRLTAARVPAGGLQGARRAMARAWALRDAPGYARQDFEVMRELVEAARFTPGLWMLNRFADIWLDAAGALGVAVRAPDEYVPVHTELFDRIEAGDADGARALMAAYLERHDQALVRALQVRA